MLMHGLLGKGDVALLNEFRGPLIALAVCLLLALLGRATKSASICAATGAAGLLAGWYGMSNTPFTLTPRLPVDRLTPLAIVLLLLTWASARFAARRGLWPPLLIAALLAAWWLGGAPRARIEALAAWQTMAAIAAAVLATGWSMGGKLADPLRPATASLVLAGALWCVAAPWMWVLLALVPAAASLPMLAAPKIITLVLLAPATGLAATCALAELALGRLPRGGFKAIDLAVLSPFIALLLMTALSGRLKFAGRFSGLLTAVLAGGIAVGAVWGARAARLL